MKKKKQPKKDGTEEQDAPGPIGAEPLTADGVDLVFVVDATASMGQFLVSLTSSFVQIISIAQVTRAFERIRIVTYYDYSDPKQTVWSPWVTSWDQLSKFVSELKPMVNRIITK